MPPRRKPPSSRPVLASLADAARDVVAPDNRIYTSGEEKIKKAEKHGILDVDRNAGRITYYVGKKDWYRNYRMPEEPIVAQAVAGLAMEYGYPDKHICLFVPVQMGASTREADIIVYADADCEQPLIVVECKKPEANEKEFRSAVDQAFSYAIAIGAKYVWATSGIKNEYYAVDKKRQGVQIVTSNIPRFGQAEPGRHKFVYNPRSDSGLSDLQKINGGELTIRFNRAHDALWAGGRMTPMDAFAEFNKVLFCKLWDEQKPRRSGEPYDFQIIAESDPELTAQKLAERIHKLYADGRKTDPDQQVFADGINLEPMPLMTIAGYLEDINLWETDVDSRGRAFETFLGSYFRGDFGQYFTPREIVRFIVDALPISQNSLVLDTSCGSGGFLLHALDRVRHEAYEYHPHNASRRDKHWGDFARYNLFGVEINDNIARAAKMNMIVHGDGHTNIVATDGLLPLSDIAKRTGNRKFKAGAFDFIVTNPPFGAVIKQVEQAYMSNYGFGWKEINWLEPDSKRNKRPSVKTEILFLEQCHNFLCEGGYLATIVPDSVLNNSSLQYARNMDGGYVSHRSGCFHAPGGIYADGRGGQLFRAVPAEILG